MAALVGRLSLLTILVFLIGSPTCYAWDSEDLEVFDVVEEVGQNFYELLEVPPDADARTIKRAFRNLSLQLHPDKNSAPDAEVKFRQLVAVHDILKDANKRSKYDDVLLNGLPDWKQAVYYFRRVRKMGLAEMAAILFIIVTIGQYCVAWAAYFEKKYAIEEFVRYKSKRIQKKMKKGKPVDEATASIMPELVNALPKPSVTCTLPVQIVRLAWFLVAVLPQLTYQRIQLYFQERAEAATKPQEEESEEEVPVVRERGPRRRKGFNLPEVAENGPKQKNSSREEQRTHTKEPEPEPEYTGGLWTDDDLCDLIRFMKKYPPGTNERWKKVGQSMKRHPQEVAVMAAKMKDCNFKPVQKEEASEPIEEAPKKVKTRVKVEVEEGTWTSVQHKALEMALAAIPKGSSGDRWARIAAAVPDKTKEECIARFKKIHEAVKKKKEGEIEADSNEPPLILDN